MSRTTPLLREQQSPSSSAPGGQNGDQHEDNPFAPPPEGRPDQPWQPRPDDADGQSGEDDQNGQRPQQPPAWGSQWSSRQPSRQGGSFGAGPGSNRPSGPSGPRWDPNDPAQRRARYALLAGMWAFFFALFSLPQIALLLGTLALYWGISSLRAKARRTTPPPAAAAPLNAPPPPPGATPAPLPAPGSGPAKPQSTAAISGLVTGGLALAIVAATFSFQVVYNDYYTCVDDALTQTSRHDCETLLPEQLRPLLSTQD
ncbi:hypothetical protein [Streptomyces violaceusniger]|uniref:Integral membrane protein n=1 Tax=Streptomyces violaceusniger (strain Tu 4113) TaxID=653045 RepID=G2P1K3_STRV4|nr:hypothetical protein [Streptomyces violaceusniger]AEM87952.1 integral membrane protein [Streptomyces violaceusniger Tu 4113]